jgi:hypothetical protein
LIRSDKEESVCASSSRHQNPAEQLPTVAIAHDPERTIAVRN